MKKQTKYKPKPVLVNPLAFVIESITPVAKHESSLLTLKLKNHNALAMLVKGEAKRKELDVLISALNTCEALVLMGFGTEYAFVAKNGLDALYKKQHPAEWVGLTDKEINSVMETSKNLEGGLVLPYGYARDIEAKLKEKNNG